jgi:Xaa-Pro aminopeptidase
MGKVFGKRLSGLFCASNLDALLLFNGELAHGCDPNFYYFTGSSIDNSLAVLTPDSATLFCAKMNLAQAKAGAWMECRETGKDVLAQVKKLIGRGKIGADFDSISASRHLRWKRALGKLFDAGKEMDTVRARKDEAEIGKIAKAVSATKKIFEKVESRLAPGRSESEIAKSLIIMAHEGGFEPSFEPIVASGANSRFPHHVPGKQKLGEGIVLVDFGVRSEGYCSDITRCYFLGGCKREKEAYGMAQDTFAELLGIMQSFKTGGGIAAESERLMKKLKLPPMPHSIGHGLGIEVHESPSLRKGSGDAIAPGNVLAIEPSAYFKSFGVRFEEDVLVLSGKKARVL